MRCHEQHRRNLITAFHFAAPAAVHPSVFGAAQTWSGPSGQQGLAGSAPSTLLGWFIEQPMLLTWLFHTHENSFSRKWEKGEDVLKDHVVLECVSREKN